ncbi:MAG: cell division protein ZapA [Rikenellaceae bacterium]
MAKQAITLKIVGKSYSFNIESDKEELYRLAEREVNRYAAEFEKQGFVGFKVQDFLAMTALKLSIANVTARGQGELKSEELKEVEKLDTRLKDYIGKLK